MNPNFDPSSELPDPMSDQRLDELLQLAMPQLDPDRQQQLRTSVAKTLVVNSHSQGWQPSKLFWGSVASIAAGIAIAVCWVSENHSPHPTTITATEIIQPDRELPSEVGIVNAEPKIEARQKTRLGDEPLTIISRVVRKDQSRTRNIKRNSALSWCWDYRRIKQSFGQAAVNQIDQTILEIANSATALKTIEQLNSQFDQVVAYRQSQHYESRRLAIRTSLLRSTEQEQVSSAAAVNRQLRILHAAREQMESYLIQNAQAKPPQLATASFRLLCHCGTQRSLPWVLQQWGRPSSQSDVSAAACRLADSLVLFALVQSTENRQLQIPLMTRLLEKGDAESLDLFLQLTAKKNLYRVAQASGALAKNAPVELLLNRLNSNRGSIARAAAITLSACDNPLITFELIRICDDPVCRQSAWMALTIRTDDTAQRFVNRSTTDIRWAATINAAQHKWSQQLAQN